MTLTLIKCNFTMALLWCIRDCSDWIEKNSEDERSSVNVSKAIECRATCIECLDAFEGSKTSIRGLLTKAVSHACYSLLKECETMISPHIQKCINSCQRCIEECENILSIREFSSFLNHPEASEWMSDELQFSETIFSRKRKATT